MDLQSLRKHAGLQPTERFNESVLLKQLDEVVQLPDDLSLDDAIKRLDACKRALAIVNRMQDPVDKKKWLSATFVNLNKVSGAVRKLLAAMPDAQPSAPAPAAAPASSSPAMPQPGASQQATA